MRKPPTFLDIDIEYHPNGERGVPFHAVLFTYIHEVFKNDGDTEPSAIVPLRMFAVVFAQWDKVAVLDVEKLYQGDIEFGSNSWRGDCFGPGLRRVIADWDALRGGRWPEVIEDQPKSTPVLSVPKTLEMRIDGHRNGVSGRPFNPMLFTAAMDGVLRRMIAVVFPKRGEVAVLDVEKLYQGDIQFGSNSWRSDLFEPQLREALKKEYGEAEAELRRLFGEAYDKSED